MKVLSKRENITTRNGKTLDVIKIRFAVYPDKEVRDSLKAKGFQYFDATYDIVDGKKVYKTAGYFGAKYDAKLWNWVNKTFEVKDTNKSFKKAKVKVAKPEPAVVLSCDVPKETKRDELMREINKLTDAELEKLLALYAVIK